MNFKKMILAAVAMVFAFSAHSGELVKKKDSFAAAPPPNFAMAHAVEGQTCHRSGDIGMSLDGLILSCQSDGSDSRWKLSKGYAEIDYSQCRSSPSITHWSGTNYLSQCPANHIAVGLYAWAGGDSAHTRITSARCCLVR
jgi:hypothetical protein